ncbi:replicative DNA helicase [Ktedonosporobacter rubrisoli]|uniref:Replicative DNA helicase n=1 Tax=Ktedonosporobacter rubrisoli TaxID=2509675 RepID=A0A4P6JZR4_KTERU|nr:replicative DNA helicase [Ktedonosporobacter rubrisoli]QBD80890.1 replicative DNA helicase [Ktedonosporobacter rubrisoli]
MEKQLPQSIEAESGVLGSMIIDPEAIAQVASFLRAEDFYRDAHRTIYEVILRLYEQREPADVITITDELERIGRLAHVGGASYITSLMNQVPTSSNAEYYGRIVERAAVLRRLIHAAAEIAAVAYEENDADVALDKAEQLIFGISQRYSTNDFSALRDLLANYMDTLDQLHERRGTVVGIPTGFTDLDRITGGLQRSDLIILAARPAVGKTSLALSLAHNTAVKFGHSVAVFSLEMSKEQLVQRLLSMDAGIDQQRLRTGWIEDEEWDRIVFSMGQLAKANVWIDDSAGISTMDMRSKARRLQSEHGIDLIIVDYLQLMQSGIGGRRNENRVQEVSEISRSLKALARELNVPVLALAQLSRTVETRQSKVPQLSDLRESGCLSGDTCVYLPDEGCSVPIEQLVGKSGFRVLALNLRTWQLEPQLVTHAFATGRKPVYRLTTSSGRTIKATANHKFLTRQGWQRLDELAMGACIAVPFALTHEAYQLVAGQAARVEEQMTRSGPMRGQAGLAVCEPAVEPIGRAVLWDEVIACEPNGEALVYDLTVDEWHNFVAANVIVHNSIEQDADIVMFIYRDDVYNPDTERKNIADIIIAKHRNGPIGEVSLFFQASQTRFCDLEVSPPSE